MSRETWSEMRTLAAARAVAIIAIILYHWLWPECLDRWQVNETSRYVAQVVTARCADALPVVDDVERVVASEWCSGLCPGLSTRWGDETYDPEAPSCRQSDVVGGLGPLPERAQFSRCNLCFVDISPGDERYVAASLIWEWFFVVKGSEASCSVDRHACGKPTVPGTTEYIKIPTERCSGRCPGLST